MAPGKHPAEWRQPPDVEALAQVALVGCTVHEAHLAAAAVFAAHEAANVVTALVHVQGGSRASRTAAVLLKALRRTRESVAIAGHPLQCSIRTECLPWETASPGEVDPAPSGHVL